MNNAQFKKLVNETPRVDRSTSAGNAPSATPALGSRQRAAIPMTPRSLGGYNPSSDFARQAAAYRTSHNAPKEKKFRSKVPLGAKLPEGYTDRTKQRDDEDTEVDDRERRMQALMEAVKEGVIDREQAIEQSKVFGGDLSSTHLVKGLDFRLLEKVKQGEDVYTAKEDEKKEEEKEEDLEDELDQALEKDVEVIKRDRKGKDEDDEDNIPKRKTRAEILADLKKSRTEAAAAAAGPTLGSKFKKISDAKSKSKKMDKQQSIDMSSTKKRKRYAEEAAQANSEATSKPVLGMLPPDLPSSKMTVAEQPKAEDDDMDIFNDAPAEYDPLAGLSDEDSDSEGEIADSKKTKDARTGDNAQMASLSAPSNKARNYFATSSKDEELSMDSIASKPLTGKELISTEELSAAIKKAATMRDLANADDEETKREAKRKVLLQAASRDDDDVDMGFGGSRTFGDDDDDDLGPTPAKNKKKKKT